jgi:putative membrane protein
MMLGHEAITPGQLWSDWNTDPGIVVPVITFAVSYVRGWTAARRRRRGELAAFVCAVATIAAALISPLDAAATALLSAHMVQHLALIVVAAPLLASCRPLRYLGAGLPRSGRRRMLRLAAHPHARRVRAVVGHPLVVAAFAAVAVWVWHLPSLYETALRHHPVHGLEHLTLLMSAVAVWAAVVRTSNRPASIPASLAALFVTGLSGAALGAVITFARRPLYPIHVPSSRLWDVSPLSDQQLAGTMMWVVPGFVYLGAIGWLVARWLTPVPATVTTETAA